MLFTVHHQAVIDLVGKKNELMLPGQVNDLLQNLLRIQRSGGIVGIDDDNRLGPVRDLLFHIFQIRIPVRLLITDIMHGLSSRKGGAGRPQGIVRRGNQNLIPIV